MRLLKILLSASAALGITLAGSAYADPPSVAGRLSYLSGAVSFAPGDAPEEWAAATLNRPITTGDRLWADDNAFAEVRVGSLAMRMAEHTAVDVLALDDRAFQLRVPQGNVQLRVRRLPPDRVMEIATPSASVVIRRPGTFRISVDSSGAMIAVVRGGGEAEVYTADSSVVVRDNEEVSVVGGALPELYAAPPLDEFDRWAESRDRREARIAATRYVPIEMTGYEDLDYYGQWRSVGNYGTVWIPTGMPADWAPYRYGHWVWVSPWGWTWVDDAPWGFAPFHYGRWVHVDNYWAWAPGRIVERPIYSPAMVAFLGGADFGVALGLGAAVGWVPLGWNEPYLPWYTASPTYVRNVNVTHVTNVTNITNVQNIRYVNRSVPTAVTVVPREAFVSARQIERAAIRVPQRLAATAPIIRTSPVAEPTRTSFVRAERGSRPPEQVSRREAVAVNAPPALSREDRRQERRLATTEQRPPVRVIERRERANVQVNPAPSADTRRPQMQAPRVMAPVEQPRAPQTVQEQQRREQRGERQREAQRTQEELQKAQAQQQTEQLERQRRQAEEQQQRARRGAADREQRAVQEQQRQELERRRQEAQRDGDERGRRAREEQQQRAIEKQRGAAEQQRAIQEQRRAAQEQERAQRSQQEQQRAIQEQRRAAQEQERAQRSQQEQQRAIQEQRRAAQEQERAQRSQQEQQQKAREQQSRQQEELRQRQEGERRAREQQSRQQEEMRQRQQQQAEQQRAREQQARQQQELRQRQAEQQQRAQQEQQRAQQAAQQRAEQQRAQQEQQRAQQAAQQRAEQQRAQQAAQQRAQQEAQRQQAQAQRAQRAAAEQRAREAQAQRQQQQAEQRGQAQPRQAPREAEKGEKGRRPAEG